MILITSPRGFTFKIPGLPGERGSRWRRSRQYDSGELDREDGKRKTKSIAASSFPDYTLSVTH